MFQCERYIRREPLGKILFFGAHLAHKCAPNPVKRCEDIGVADAKSRMKSGFSRYREKPQKESAATPTLEVVGSNPVSRTKTPASI